MNNKSQIVNTLTIALAVIILIGGIHFVSDDPVITGFTVRSNADQDVVSQINENGNAKVIIYFKDDNQIKSSGTHDKKIKIKQKQDNTLSKLNYEDFELRNKYSTINAISGSLTQAGLSKLENDPDVEKIVLVKKVSIDLTDSVPLIKASKVWNQSVNGINLTGQGQSICVIDTGVDYHHNALGNCTLTNVTQHKCKVIAGYDFVDLDNDPLDDNDHGTHVAGIAAGNGGGVVGVAKEAYIVAIKALDIGGSGDDADVAAGIDWCVNNATMFNISVVSMSLGDAQIHPGVSVCPSLTSPIENAMESAVAANLSVFAASGNQGSVLGINYPACSPFAISVGASTKADAMGSITNTHSLLNIVAPGISIVSSKRAGTTVSNSGTSMATPHAAGVAALLYQKEQLLNNRKPKQSQILSILKRSNVSISDSGLSFPRINALQAVSDILRLNISDNSATADNVKLKFVAATNIENVSEAFVFNNNFISLNSSRYPQYNKSANITFFNLTFTENPVILRNGLPCNKCKVLGYDGENLTFNVTSFTNYTSAANAQLQIFDQVDTEGGSRIAKVGLKPVYFYANYTNTTSGLAINTGNCAINFTDMNKSITFNVSSNLFEFNRTFSSSNTFNYNMTCSATSYETLTTSDSIFVSPGCLAQTPNTNITVNKNQKINCTDEVFRLRNQSINVYGNFIINNTQIILESTGTASNSINVFNRSNLTIINSILNGTVNTFTIFGYNFTKVRANMSTLENVNFDIKGNSTTRFRSINSTGSITLRGNSNNSFNKLLSTNTFDAQGISRNIIENSTLNFEIFSKQNSRTKIKNSQLNMTFFRESSYTEIRNSNISNLSQLGNSLAQTAIVNFTRPRSNVSHIAEIRFRSRIYGYVDLPSKANRYHTIINVRRFYPVHVNFTDGSPASAKLVNITNISNSAQIWAGFTNSQGFANPNITFTNDNNVTNYSVKVNPSMNTSLLTDTPLIFTLSDTTIPEVSRIRPNISIEDISVNFNATVADDIAINECRLYIDNSLNGSMTVVGTLANRTVTMFTPGLYSFLANCTDTSGNYNDTSVTSVTILDILPPIILNVNDSGISNQSARINWTTNVTSNTSVNYGNTISLGTITAINNNVINHTRLVSGLLNNTLYFYNVTSCNSQGCVTNGTFNFTTDQNTAPAPGGGSGGGGGGGSSVITCVSLWLCDAWPTCTNGQQSRYCEDLNGCLNPKTETQSCTVQAQPDRQGGHSGVLEPTKAVEEPTVAAILETPKGTMIKQSYLSLIWLVISLILILLFVRRVDTFPLALWKEEKYIKKGDLTRAEKLFDKLTVRFARSKERERRYVERIENLSKELEEMEKQKPKAMVIKPATEIIYKELKYEDALKQYKETLNEYLALPASERKRLESKITDLKKKLVELGKKGQKYA